MSITVNGIEISDDAIHAEMQYHPAPSRDMAEYSAKLALVARQLMLQEAARLNISDADEEERLTALVEREIEAPQVDESHCQRFFQANRQRLRSGDQFEVSHILCAAPPDDAAARATARTRANEVISRLGQGSGFGELALELSDCPSKERHGSLGQLAAGQTVPEFEQALQAMHDDEISAQPVESRFGFHIIHLHRKTEGLPLEYAQVREQIASYLHDSARHKAMSQYLAALIGRADIQGIDLLGTDSPLLR